jgi:hypothetical protein
MFVILAPLDLRIISPIKKLGGAFTARGKADSHAENAEKRGMFL